MELSDFTIRFISVVDLLKPESQKAFAESIGLTKQKWNNIRSALNDVPAKTLAAFLERYPNVNANYILTGNGDIFLNGGEEAAGEEEMRMLIKRLNTAYDEIERLQAELAEAKSQLAAQKAG